MYCRACGKEIAKNSSICMSCGVPVGKGKRFCPVCGIRGEEEAVYCVKCGIGFAPVKPQVSKDAKSRVAAGVMGFFCGFLGVHNFYLGHILKALAQLGLSLIWLLGIFILAMDNTETGLVVFLLGIFGLAASWIWSFVEVILILCGIKNTDGKGNALRD